MGDKTDKNDIRKEVRLNGNDTLNLMDMSHDLGISESDVIRMGLRLLHKKLIETGLVKDTGRAP